jgi:hypothetical protein
MDALQAATSCSRNQSLWFTRGDCGARVIEIPLPVHDRHTASR